MTYSATNLPTGLTINPSTGLISGTVVNTVAVQTYQVSVVVDDSDTSNADAQTLNFEWLLMDPSMSATELWLEAECATVGTNWTEINDASASNGIYLLAPTTNYNSAPSPDTANSLLFSFFISTPGQYKIFGRTIAPTEMTIHTG